VRRFEGGFVGDYRIVKIDGKPRDAGFEAQGVQSLHSDWRAVLSVDGGVQILPEDIELFAGRDNLRAWKAEMRVPDEMAGNCVDCDVGDGHFGKALDGEAGGLGKDRAGLRTFDGERAEFVGGVFERNVVHDDEFVEGLNGALANGGVREDEQLFFERVDFKFREDVALRVEEQGQRARAFAERFNVIRYDRIEVADAIGTGESDGGVPVGVEESDGFAGRAVFGVEVGEDFWEGAAGEVSEFGAFGEFEFCERRFHLNFIVTERKKRDIAATELGGTEGSARLA
jgi:hypothetical protein